MWRAVANVLLSIAMCHYRTKSGLMILSTNPSNEVYEKFGVAEVFKGQERRMI